MHIIIVTLAMHCIQYFYFLLISRSVLIKTAVNKAMSEIFHFDCVSFLLKLIFLFNRKHGIFDFKVSQNSFRNKNRKATHSFALRSLIFKMQEEVLKFNDICVSCSSPKTDLEMNFLNLESRSFDYVSFSQ